MRRFLRWSLIWSVMVLLLAGTAGVVAEPAGVLVLDARALASVKERIEAGDARYDGALARLQADADRALESGPFSVTDKAGVPPSGDKRDYMSIGPFWWPDPEQEDGLPYKRRDGDRNPASRDDTYDRQRLGEMTDAVSTLALAYYFTDHEPYAEHAAKLLRVWFLDDETAMNPHMEYAQAIPGRVDGRGIGIIDTAGWIRLIDAVGMLQGSQHWSEQDHQQLQQWFEQYIDWLKTSDHGRDEQEHHNNHGTWFDAQIVAYMLFCDQPDKARAQLTEWTKQRIDDHFDERGRQAYELERAEGWHYAIYNLDAYALAARLARHVELDLWDYQSDEGRSIRDGVDYLLGYLGRMEQWDHDGQASTPDPDRLVRRLLPAAIHASDDPAYREAFDKIGPDRFEDTRKRLIHPYLFEQP